MEAVYSSETLIPTYQPAQCYEPEDHINLHCGKNLKYYDTNLFLKF
jgi:hypothetical protein